MLHYLIEGFPMSYDTLFDLKITSVGQIEKTQTHLEDVIAEINSDKLSREEIVEKLLKVKQGLRNLQAEDILADLFSRSEEARYALKENGDARQLSRWYNWKEEILEFSQLYPAWLFTLNGQGENNGDIWRAYIKAGKIQFSQAQIILEDLDLDKLV